MDHLFYDLVEQIVCYLPRKDVETIGRVAKRSPQLKNWSAAAEDQLENRFLLDVYARVQKPDVRNGDPKMWLRARKVPSKGRTTDWDFTRWRYAWIRSVKIGYTKLKITTQPTMDQVLRTLSLPVEQNVSSSLALAGANKSHAVTNLFAKFLWATQKQFTKVALSWSRGDLEVSVADYFWRGPFIQELNLTGHNSHHMLSAAIGKLFERTRRRPLKIQLRNIWFYDYEIKGIVNKWLYSAGTYGGKELCSSSCNFWEVVKRDIEDVVECPGGGYVAHPKKHSSLYVTNDTISVVEFRPWHVRVDFEWIDSVIDKWKEGDGKYVYKDDADSSGVKELSFIFKVAEDWIKLVKKYGRLGAKKRMNASDLMDKTIPSIAHPSEKRWLEVMKVGEYVEVYVTGYWSCTGRPYSPSSD